MQKRACEEERNFALTGENMRLSHVVLLLALVFVMAGKGCQRSSTPEIKIGLNVALTGESPAIGASCKDGALLAVDQINAAGGIQVGNQKLPLQLIVIDNGGKPDRAVSVAKKLIAQDNVLAMVGPNVSACAIPASEIANSLGCLMISPWSTNPKTTRTARGKAKKYVFRTCFTDPFEMSALAKFAINNLKAKRAAILYDIASEAPNSQANFFRKAYEKAGGTITAFETYTTGDRDFSAQLTKIKASHPDLIVLPAYYNDAALITQQARSLGITQPFLGSDAWSTPEIISLAGENIEGAYFCNHYSTQTPTPIAQKFVSDYQAKFGRDPDDVAALTYDTFQLLARAIQTAGRLDRSAVRDAFSKIQDYEGVTGTIQFNPGSGDPTKSAVILRIQSGKFIWFSNASP